MPATDPTSDRYRLSRAQYERAVETGVSAPDARLELIDGEILTMTPQDSRHTTGVELVSERSARRSAQASACACSSVGGGRLLGA